MKIIYFLFLLPFICNAQVNRVDYYFRTNNTIDTTGIRTFLIFDTNNSVYIHNSINSNIKNEIGESDDVDIKLVRRIRDTIGFRVYNNFEDDSISVLDKIDTKRYSFKEDKTIEWELFDDFKEIGGLNCQLARTMFRGRKFDVWFTSSIPISSGPWKLNGLPGLILEVEDSLKQVSFKLKSISYEEDVNVFFEDFTIKASNTTLKKFVEKKDNLAQHYLKETLAKLPRNARGDVVSSTSRMGIELSYEWEEEK